ncbi:hypothetical protein LMG9673_04670 [Ralstonia pseudosolanacearum]|nr:hypothetical protein LMG9673_04670 [Ralstonia pseudosolanacearum]
MDLPTETPKRNVIIADLASNRLVHVVWKLALACNLKCQHYGSRAGQAKQQELTTEKAIGLIKDIAALSAREISLIDGNRLWRYSS